MIKEIPILVSGGLIPPVMSGLKTMTRRLNKLDLINEQPGKWTFVEVESPFKDPYIYWFEGQGERVAIKCPYGKAGDLLWVRENFRVNSWVPDDGEVSFRYEADGAVSPLLVVDFEASDCEKFNKYWEQSCTDLAKAGYEPGEDERYAEYDYKALRLRPNIFLPKEASRIWLRVESVRVERLQDISEEDAIAEGVKPAHCETNQGCPSLNCKEQCCEIGNYWNYRAPDGEGFPAFSARSSFESLWESINGAESLKANPWVWVISFTVLSTTGKPDLQLINK